MISPRNQVLIDIVKVVKEDRFLRRNLNLNEVYVKWSVGSNVVDDAFYAYFARNRNKLKKILSIKLHNVNQIANARQELIFQLYKFPGEERNFQKLCSLQHRLKIWAERLGDDFFELYPCFHAQLRAAGIWLGVMKNHSDFKENIQKLYKHMLLTGSERQITLYDLGDTRIELSTQESKCVSSLFRLGCLWLLTRHSKDYLSQYLLGKAVSTMIPVFSLVKSRSLGESLQERFLWAYEKSDKSVLEKLVENSKSIGKDTFDEFFYPSLDGDNYLLMAEKYLGDCVEMKKLMAQNNAWPSLVKANGAVKMHAARKRDLLYYTRNLRYIS